MERNVRYIVFLALLLPLLIAADLKGTVYRCMYGITFPTPPASLGEPDEILEYDLSGWLVF
jgi:hypothetical protein